MAPMSIRLRRLPILIHTTPCTVLELVVRDSLELLIYLHLLIPIQHSHLAKSHTPTHHLSIQHRLQAYNGTTISTFPGISQAINHGPPATLLHAEKTRVKEQETQNPANSIYSSPCHPGLARVPLKSTKRLISIATIFNPRTKLARKLFSTSSDAYPFPFAHV